jgi:membrane protein DedA with SNARE-associated domain
VSGVRSRSIGTLSQHAPLAGVLLALLLGGLGFPIPEDLALLGAGYLVWHGDTTLAWAIPVCLFGIIAGDVMLYWIGRAFGERITQHRFISHALTPARLERVRGYFHRHGEKTLLVARLVAGARAFFFLAAGTMRMSFARFLLFDVLGACVAVAVWISVGYFFGAHIHHVRSVITRVEHWILIALVVVAAAWVFHRLSRRKVSGPPEPTL